MGYAEDLISLAVQISKQNQPTSDGLEGTVAPGSYNPADGTISVRVGNTISNPGDEFDTEMVIPNVRVMTNGIGVQSGPSGDERVVLHKIEGGYVASHVHDLDDSPGAGAGEIWSQQRLDPSTFSKLLSGGIHSLGASTQINAIAPQVALGYDQPDTSTDGVVRLEDMQNYGNAIISAVQAAFNQLCLTIQSGPGVPSPQVQQPTPTASQTTFSKE